MREPGRWGCDEGFSRRVQRGFEARNLEGAPQRSQDGDVILDNGNKGRERRRTTCEKYASRGAFAIAPWFYLT